VSFKKRHKINQLMRQVGRDLDGRCTDELHQRLRRIRMYVKRRVAGA